MRDKLKTAEEQSLMLKLSNDNWASTIDQLKREKDEVFHVIITLRWASPLTSS